MNWQPIETAPKDGTEIILWHDATYDDGMPVFAHWDENLNDWHSSDYCIYAPTHWHKIDPPS